MERSVVATEKIASDWLIAQLHLTLARRDLAVIVQANPAWRNHNLPRIRALNDWVLQTRETSEMRLQAEQMGCSLLDWLRNHDGANAAHISAWGQMQPTYPVAFALAASQTAAGVGDCMLTYVFGWAENMMQAALISVPLGQSAGHRILARLGRSIPAAVESALQLEDSERQAFSPNWRACRIGQDHLAGNAVQGHAAKI